jgi:hypothetical protein
MKAYLMGILLMAAVLFMGCDAKDYSQNMQSATVRASVDLSVTAALDEVPKDEVSYLKMKEMLVLGATDVKKLMNDGSIADLPLEQIEQLIKDLLKKKGWDQPLIDQILDTVKNYLAMQKIPVEKIKPFARFLVIEAMDSVIEATTASKWEWRRADKTTTVKVDTTMTGDTKIKVESKDTK